jgi:hypothetical protein
VADCLVGMVNDHFNDSPPPEKNFSGTTNNIPIQLILCPNQHVDHSEVRMHFQVSKDLAAHHIGVISLPEQFGKVNIIFYNDLEGFSISTSCYNSHIIVIR